MQKTNLTQGSLTGAHVPYIMEDNEGKRMGKGLAYVKPGQTEQHALTELEICVNKIQIEKKLLVALVIEDIVEFMKKEMDAGEKIKQQATKGDLLRLKITHPEDPNQKMSVCFRKSVLKQYADPQIHQKVSSIPVIERKPFDYLMREVEKEMAKNLGQNTFSFVIRHTESIQSLKDSAIVQTIVIKTIESVKNNKKTFLMLDQSFASFLDI